MPYEDIEVFHETHNEVRAENLSKNINVAPKFKGDTENKPHFTILEINDIQISIFLPPL